jgi:hypothetical protein
MKEIIFTLFCLSVPIIGVITFIHGVKLLFRFLREWRHLRIRRRFRQPVSARVVHSGVIERTNNLFNTVYDVALCFEYTVDDRSYTSCTVKAPDLLDWEWKQAAENIARIQYPIGRQVTVHYRPSNPADAALVGVPTESMTNNLLGGCLFTLIGGGLFVGFIAYMIVFLIAASMAD